ncbi:C-GCAxxG-C-C family protein [Bacteroidota bacterium]
MNKSEQAKKTFLSGFNCAQSVQSSFSEELGLDRDLALKLSYGFGGGMGKLQETCGAVTGAFMALGLKHGMTEVDPEVKEANYAKVKEFTQRFEEIHGSIKCIDLVETDLNTKEGAAYFKENDLLNEVCAKCVGDAVRIVEEMLGK